MALSRATKENLVSQYQDGLAAAPNAFLVSFQGISVPQVTELRAKIRENGGEYVVVKNTLALRAIEGQALGGLKEQFEGPTAVVYGDSDPVALAKTLTDFAKTAPVIQFKGGLVESQPVEAEQIQDIAAMPSREELIAKLLFLLQSPVSRFVQALGAIPAQFVQVLGQVSAKKEQG
ncbi:MAG: 50S ribosomal protein L10 [Acidobacteriota bacterium]